MTKDQVVFYCPRCQHAVGYLAVTATHRHSRAAGGCGGAVRRETEAERAKRWPEKGGWVRA